MGLIAVYRIWVKVELPKTKVSGRQVDHEASPKSNDVNSDNNVLSIMKRLQDTAAINTVSINRCANHLGIEAVFKCKICGKNLCSDCTLHVNSIPFCGDCSNRY